MFYLLTSNLTWSSSKNIYKLLQGNVTVRANKLSINELLELVFAAISLRSANITPLLTKMGGQNWQKGTRSCLNILGCLSEKTLKLRVKTTKDLHNQERDLTDGGHTSSPQGQPPVKLTHLPRPISECPIRGTECLPQPHRPECSTHHILTSYSIGLSSCLLLGMLLWRTFLFLDDLMTQYNKLYRLNVVMT